MDLSTTTAPRSDQQNYDDVASTPRIVTVTEVKGGTAEQPVEIHLAEYPGRPYKPSKSMRRVLVAAWGDQGDTYTGRRIKLIGDPTVTFGREVVGGIKIEALSHIDKPVTVKLTVTRGRRNDYTVMPLADEPKPQQPEPHTGIVKAFSDLGVNVALLEWKLGRDRADWTADDAATLTALGKKIKAGDTTVEAEFAADGEG